MVQQARVLAAALGDDRRLDGERASHDSSRGSSSRSDARFRVYDATRRARRRFRARRPPARRRTRPTTSVRAASTATSTRGRCSTASARGWPTGRERLAAMPRRSRRRRTGRRRGAPAAGPPPEVRAALDGRYGAATRVHGRAALGHALQRRARSAATAPSSARSSSSQSTFRILQALYDIRLRIFEIVVASLVAAALLTALAADDDRAAAAAAAAPGVGAGRAARAAARRFPGADAARRDRRAGAGARRADPPHQRSHRSCCSRSRPTSRTS